MTLALDLYATPISYIIVGAYLLRYCRSPASRKLTIRAGNVGRRRESGGLESEVLAALWAAGKPLTAGDVVGALGSELAYTTVQTILTRLHGKGAVRRAQVGRAHAYTPVLDEAGLAANRMHAMLDRGGDHAAVLTRFLGTLTADQEATLAQLLHQHQATSGER